MKRFFSWLANLFSTQAAPPRRELTQSGSHLRQTGSRVKPGSAAVQQAVPRRQPEFVNPDPQLAGRIVESGPGKSVLVGSKFVREDSGTHETLTILDDSITQTDDDVGTNPYDTGDFDRSKNWDKRFRNS